MTNRILIAGALGLGLFTTAGAQSKKLVAGNPAPPLKVEAWVKGGPVQFEKGKVYVVEFWATWCAPCIEAMPHLSDLADKMKGKAEFISINVSDRIPEGESKPGSKAHVDRITKFVNNNANKMRYNVALDDAAGTMAKTWMVASGQLGIPCAFVVDQSGKIAWMGHPAMGLNEVVEQVYEKKFDAQAFGAKYSGPIKQRMEEQEALKKLAAKGNLKDVEKAYLNRAAKVKNPDYLAASLLAYELSLKHPSTALAFVKNRANGDMKNDFGATAGMAVYISPNLKRDKKAAQGIRELSLEFTKGVKVGNQAIIYAYHARVLLALGDPNGANIWLDRAATKLAVYEPAEYRKNIKKYIDDSRAKVAKTKPQ